MAKRLDFSSGSPLIGNPIVFYVTSETVGKNALFHNVKLIVTARIPSITGSEMVYEFSSPAGDSEDVIFDISTALRSVASQYEYKCFVSEPNYNDEYYPRISYDVLAYDEWLMNGQITTGFNKREYTDFSAFMGAFTNKECFLSGNFGEVKTLTRKPKKGEVCSLGEVYISVSEINFKSEVNGVLDLWAPNTFRPKVYYRIMEEGGIQEVPFGRKVYVDSDTTNRILFQFVNGYGVIETISAEMLEEVGSSGETEVDVVTAPSSFNKPRAEVARRSDRRTVYKCSSGYVNKEWAEWWVTEFLGGDAFRRSGHSQCWVFLGGNWIPCTVVPDDDITLYDRSKPGLIHVDFEVSVL